MSAGVLWCCDIVSNKYLWSHNQSSAICYFYLISTDPDAPSRANPVRREFRHWLVGNIPGDKLDQGETLTEYVGSGPPKDTGKVEYYILLVYFVGVHSGGRVHQPIMYKFTSLICCTENCIWLGVTERYINGAYTVWECKKVKFIL